MPLLSIRRTHFSSVLVLLATLSAHPAAASVLPFTGDIQIELSGLVTSFGGAGFATINGSGGGAHVASLGLMPGAFATSGLAIVVTDLAAAPIKGIQITAANGPGAFAETSMGTLKGSMPLLGVSKVCLFTSCSASIANLAVPLTVIGAGGQAFASGAVNVTVAGAPWTTGTAANFLPYSPFISTRMGYAHGPGSHASSTGAASGSIQLVTPYVVWTNIGADQPSVFGFATATLHFVPEPATLAMLAGGCVLLGLRARRRAARA